MGGGRAGNHTRRWMGHRMTDHCVGDLTWVGLVAGGVGGDHKVKRLHRDWGSLGLGLRLNAQRSGASCQVPGAGSR